jgi:nitrogen fixation protein FixH
MTTLAAQPTTEARARRRWVALILGLFMAQIGLWIGAIAFVSGDRSHAVVDDYDRAAVDWDERRRLEQASAATGWHAAVAIDSGPQDGDRRRVSVRLSDTAGHDVAGAEVEVVLFHQARASEAQSVALAPGASGAYEGLARIARPGKWKVRVQATRAADRFTSTYVHELRLGSATP